MELLIILIIFVNNATKNAKLERLPLLITWTLVLNNCLCNDNYYDSGFMSTMFILMHYLQYIIE